jgi:hypothetical protein
MNAYLPFISEYWKFALFAGGNPANGGRGTRASTVTAGFALFLGVSA